MSLAVSSLPLPDSPVMRTGASTAAILSISLISAWMAGELPTRETPARDGVVWPECESARPSSDAMASVLSSTWLAWSGCRGSGRQAWQYRAMNLTVRSSWRLWGGNSATHSRSGTRLSTLSRCRGGAGLQAFQQDDSQWRWAGGQERFGFDQAAGTAKLPCILRHRQCRNSLQRLATQQQGLA